MFFFAQFHRRSGFPKFFSSQSIYLTNYTNIICDSAVDSTSKNEVHRQLLQRFKTPPLPSATRFGDNLNSFLASRTERLHAQQVGRNQQCFFNPNLQAGVVYAQEPGIKIDKVVVCCLKPSMWYQPLKSRVWHIPKQKHGTLGFGIDMAHCWLCEGGGFWGGSFLCFSISHSHNHETALAPHTYV